VRTPRPRLQGPGRHLRAGVLHVSLRRDQVSLIYRSWRA
jgi:hypothetical protein